MKELIIALQACLDIAVNDDIINAEQYDLVRAHIESLEDLTIRNDAMGYIKDQITSHISIPRDNAAGALASVCVMLTTYGSKPDAMLAVIHDKGWPVVTLADVEAVRTFILEQ